MYEWFNVLKLILNFKKKFKNIQCMYDGCPKIGCKLQKKNLKYPMYVWWMF